MNAVVQGVGNHEFTWSGCNNNVAVSKTEHNYIVIIILISPTTGFADT